MYKLDKNKENNKRAVFFIPGISGEAFTGRFANFYLSCLEKRWDVLRMQTWENVKELEAMNVAEIHRSIDEGIRRLKEDDYDEIVAVGKSFGGAMFLSRNNRDISKMVLWAPAIGVSEDKSNLEEMLNVPFSEINSLQEITLNKEFLSSVNTPVRIIQGTNDESVSVENSRRITSLLPKAELVQIEGMGHSYKTKEQEEIVLKATLDFL